MTVLVQTRTDLTLDAARRVAWAGERVELGATALAAMARGRERLERIIEHDPDVTIYGVTTGPGQLARKTLTPEQRERWAGMSPARIAASWGDPLPERVVRAIVLARLTNFVEGTPRSRRRSPSVSPPCWMGTRCPPSRPRARAAPARSCR